MSNGNIGVDVLLDEIDDCIERLKECSKEKQPSPLCVIHEQSIVTLLRVEKYRLQRFKRMFRWTAITSSIIGLIASAVYAAVKLVH